MFNINDLIYGKRANPEASNTDYSKVLSFVKDYINEHHRNDLAGDITVDLAKDRYKILIRQVVHDKNLFVKGHTEEGLIELLYNSMAKYDFLTPYLEGNSGALPDDPLYEIWEEINCNRYDDVEVVVEGKYYKLEKAFDSPKSCVDILRRMVRLGGLTLDKSNPRGASYLGTGIRIFATLPPCVDADTGAAFSIRRQKSITNNRQFFLDNGTACGEELDFLIDLVNNGISVAFAGPTSSGKTTDINFVLRNINSEKRIYTIEDSRELDLQRKDSTGRYVSRVVHTVTKISEDEAQAVTAEDLVRDSLRYDPDILGLGEMRGREAKPTINAGGTGHVIITGLHAGGPRSAYRRIATLYMDAGTNLHEKVVYQNIVEAIPIIVHKKAFKSGERRYMSICEAVLSTDILNPEISFNVIYKYVVEGFERDKDDKICKVLGKHEKVGNISPQLAQKLFENGLKLSVIREYAGADFTPGKEYDL